jgi:RHS repeat-associated protein
MQTGVWNTNVEQYDGYGRISQTELVTDPDGADFTATTYDSLGRVARHYNPTRCNPPTTNCGEQTWGYTSYTYDALGRTTQVTNPDNSTVITTYTGRATQVQDEGNGTQRITRISQTDGLGRLTSVCEVRGASLIGSGGTPGACGQDIAATGFLTSYQYDGLDNLTSVSMSGLNPRTFTYDSLSRLTSANNPESGQTCYGTVSAGVCQANGYDANGNLVAKTDARSIAATYGYDTLNRITQKTYSDSTPSMYYTYDVHPSWGLSDVTNVVGRLVEARNQYAGTTGSGTDTVNSYDAMGRVIRQWQQTPDLAPGGDFLYYTYDLAGDLASSTNGVGVTFNNTVNGAVRLTTMTSSLVDSNHPGTLFSAAHYNAAGSLLSGSLGTVISETRTYDPRLRLASIADGSNYSLTIPSSGGYAPNSDILSANDSVNGNWTYSYDDFNRLSGSNQNSGQAVYSYVYDRFGNRWQQNGPHTFLATFTGNNPGNPQNNNRMDGYSYDAAGNLLNDGTHSYAYDAENRISNVDNGSTASYVYDANGQRVRKTTSSGSVDYLYDLAGHEITEVSSSGSWNRGEVYAGGRHLATYNNSTTYLIHSDHLGTERVRTDSSGTSCETVASLPFGDWQTTSGSCGDPSPMHFTGKERDSESGLDNFGARYDSSSLGRFMSPDPYNAGAFLDAPQSWNAYSYVLNNPLNAIDPNGLDCVYAAGASDNPNPHEDGSATVIPGDCKNEGGKNDSGVFVDNDENHPVHPSDVTVSNDGSVGLISYTRTDGLTTGYACMGNCPSDSVQVNAAPPGTPTMSAAHYPGTLTPPTQILFQPPTTFWQRLAVAAGCTVGLDAELMGPEIGPSNGNDKPESKLTEGKYKVPFMRGTPGRPPEMNKSGKSNAEAMTAAGGGAALVGNQQACLQNASGQR